MRTFLENWALRRQARRGTGTRVPVRPPGSTLDDKRNQTFYKDQNKKNKALSDGDPMKDLETLIQGGHSVPPTVFSENNVVVASSKKTKNDICIQKCVLYVYVMVSEQFFCFGSFPR